MAFDFTGYSKGLKEDVENRSNFGKNNKAGNGGNSNWGPRPQAVILKKGTPHVVRMVGLPPHAEEISHGTTKAGPFDAFCFSYLSVMNASNPGHAANLILPSQRGKKGDDVHPIVRMAREILKEQTSNGASIPIYSSKFPELYAFAKFGGFPSDSAQRYYHSFKPYEVTVFNCIDREDDWCAKNKHTKLIARSGQDKDDGTQAFVEYGLKGNPFDTALVKCMTYAPEINGYDIAITLTGKKEEPIIVDDVSDEKDSRTFAKTGCTEEQREMIVVGPLTAEELSYELYDLPKEFRPSSPKKIFDVCGEFARKFDDAFDTNYYPLLKQQADDWVAEQEAKKAEKTAEAEAKVEAATNEAVEKATRTVAEEVPAKAEEVEIDTGIKQLPHIDVLKPEFWPAILSIKKDGDKFTATFASDDKYRQKADCDCGFRAPVAFNACPVCGSIFED